jgi:hypothetical protein
MFQKSQRKQLKSGKKTTKLATVISETYSTDQPLMKEGASLFSLGYIPNNCDFESELVFFAEYCYVVSKLTKETKRFELLHDFGEQLSICTNNAGAFRQCFQKDNLVNRISILLMDTIAVLTSVDLNKFQTHFNSGLFKPSTINIYRNNKYGQPIKTKTNRILITTGDIRAILLGLVSKKQPKTRDKWIASLDGMSESNLKGCDGFACIASILIEIFSYANVRLLSGDAKGTIGLFAAADYSAIELSGERQRICVGFNLMTSSINTYNSIYLKRTEQTISKVDLLSTSITSTTTQLKYILSRGNRGIFGVIYASNSSAGSGEFGTINSGVANCTCTTPGTTDVNMMVIDSEGVYVKYEVPLTCELSVLSLLEDIVVGDELLWDYPWDRTDYSDPNNPKQLTRLTQLEVT